jgi:hypothetical protein
VRNVSGRSAIPITQVATKLEAGGTSQGGGEGDEAAAVVAFDHILVLLWIAKILGRTAPGQKTGIEDLALRFCVSHASFPAEEKSGSRRIRRCGAGRRWPIVRLQRRAWRSVTTKLNILIPSVTVG